MDAAIRGDGRHQQPQVSSNEVVAFGRERKYDEVQPSVVTVA